MLIISLNIDSKVHILLKPADNRSKYLTPNCRHYLSTLFYRTEIKLEASAAEPIRAPAAVPAVGIIGSCLVYNLLPICSIVALSILLVRFELIENRYATVIYSHRSAKVFWTMKVYPVNLLANLLQYLSKSPKRA
jgi:hypothetical protein